MPPDTPLAERALGLDSQRTLHWLQAAVVLALAVPALIFAAVAWTAWRGAFTDAEQRLERTLRVASEHALRVFDTSNALLDRVYDLLGDDGPEALLARERQIHAKLAAMSSSLPHLQSIWVFDAQGNALAGNRFYPRPAGLNVADREFFQWHASGRRGEFVTETLWGKVTNQPFFDLSRRRETPDGRFAGLVSVGLHPQHFADFYAQLSANSGISVSLLRRDGAYIARWPQMPALGTRLPPEHVLMRQLVGGATEGTLRADGTFNGEPRLGAFRLVGEYPLVLVVGIDRAVVVGGWQREVGVLAAFTFPTALGLAWVAYVALRRTRRELALAAQLQQETAHRQRVEEALRQSQKLEAMGHLTGGVAHDFNNLLSVISNNVYLIRRLQPQVGDGPQVAAIERAVGSGVKLTRQLLAFSRRQPLAPQLTTLQQALPALHDLLRSAVGSAVQLTIEVDPRTAPIRVDSAEFELALLNLAVNAKDAMPEGGELSIRAANEDEAGSPTVRLDVSDTGVGIAEELRERVFEPFFTTKAAGRGTGLGLAQVASLCQRIGARIELVSALGRGTRFTMHIPAATQTAAVPAEAQPESAASATRLSLDAGVLLVEDNEAVAQATREVLEAMGCRVRQAASGDAALGLLAAPRGREGIDVVLTDISMPGAIDGIELAEWVRRLDPPLPVVLVTGYSHQLDAALQQRFEVLAKPCSPEALGAALRRALRDRAGAAARVAAPAG